MNKFTKLAKNGEWTRRAWYQNGVKNNRRYGKRYINGCVMINTQDGPTFFPHWTDRCQP